MCGDDAIQKISENWEKYILKILEHGEVEIPDSESITELTILQAIQIMDKGFRPLGAAAKSDAAFSIHEVCVYKGVLFNASY